MSYATYCRSHENMPYTEDELLPMSALQHLLFCERQCALIHLEGVWAENRLTVEGRHLHERVHEQEGELREGVWIGRGVRLRSMRLGLIGVSDVVEFHRVEKGGATQSIGSMSYLTGCLGRLSISAGAPNRTTRTVYSSARKPCAWRRCWVS